MEKVSLFEGVRSDARPFDAVAVRRVTLLAMPVYGLIVLRFFKQTKAVSTCKCIIKAI